MTQEENEKGGSEMGGKEGKEREGERISSWMAIEMQLLFFFFLKWMNPAPSLRQDPFSPSQSDTYSSLASIYAARLDFHMGAWSTNGTDGRKALMRLITMKKDATLSQKVPLLTSQLRGGYF